MNSSNIPRKKGTTSAAPATKIFKQKKQWQQVENTAKK